MVVGYVCDELELTRLKRKSRGMDSIESRWSECGETREDVKRNQNSSEFTFWLFRLQNLVSPLSRHPFISRPS